MNQNNTKIANAVIWNFTLTASKTAIQSDAFGRTKLNWVLNLVELEIFNLFKEISILEK